MANPIGEYFDVFNKTAKRQWLRALRSGKYKQGKGKLRNANRQGEYLCCLGVFQDVRGFKIPGNNMILADQDTNATHVKGLSYRMQAKLASLNDKGYTFHEIADFIEKKIKPV